MITRQSKERVMALCPDHDTQHGALDEALYALWAVRVLDNWARKHGHTTPSPVLWDAGSDTRNAVYRIWIPGYELTPDMGFIRRPFQGRSEDGARIVAAENLVVEDPTINPIPGIPFT
jgi:hypothetical protein